MSDKKAKSDECCPQFDPAKYDEQEVTFENKLFVQDKIASIFHFPINFGKVMVRIMEKVEKAGAENEDALYLTDETSIFGTPIFLAVNKEIPEAETIKMTGKFLVKVFEGSFSQMRKFVKEMQEYVGKKNKTAEKMYFYYPYCPKCAKKYGKNYVVIYAKVG